MYVVAHEDDSLLFQSPDLLEDIRDGGCVRTVFLTAGDDGEGESYWITREEGAEAGYARMAGVADEWEGSSIEVEGHPLRLKTLEADSRLSLVFMRLPDGGYPAGEGTTPHFESLMKLWNGGKGGSPSEPDIDTVDEEAPAPFATTYDFGGLVNTLAALMNSFEPQWIATQNYTGAFGNGDHPDHVATAKFVKEAQGSYSAPHWLTGYEDYETSLKPANLLGEPLEAKKAAFDAYSEYDKACTEGSECAAAYEGWLERQYVAAEELIGNPTPTAVAGPRQSVASGATATLDGSQSVNPYRQPLAYKWTQTGGSAVGLVGAAGAKPSFTAPPGPASLTFSLVVTNAVASSAPATVSVVVDPASSGSGGSSSPPPTSQVGGSVADLRLSRQSIELVLRRRKRTHRAVSVLGPSLQRVWCTGRLPKGARCRAVGRDKIAVEAAPFTRSAGVYRLIVHIESAVGTVKRKLAVRLRAPGRKKRR